MAVKHECDRCKKLEDAGNLRDWCRANVIPLGAQARGVDTKQLAHGVGYVNIEVCGSCAKDIMEFAIRKRLG
jgi:hypothetical protein